jgi:hypothetical protein
MFTYVRRRRALIAPLAGATLLALSVSVASSHARQIDVRELPRSTPQNAQFAALAAGTTYQASLVSPTPRLTPQVRGWRGTQFLTRRHRKAAYETVGVVWRDRLDRGILILSGPALTLSPAATIAHAQRPDWNFAPYDPPGPVQRWTVAGRRALYFDATAPPPGEWSLVGSNPPEVRIVHDRSFRMAALSVRAQTVVIVIEAPAADFPQFLPTAKRLLASLRFPPS